MCTETVAWRVGFSMSTRRLNRIEWLTKGLKSPWPPAVASRGRCCGCRTDRRARHAGHRAHRAGQPRPRWAADLVCMGGIWLCTADCTISMMMRRGSLTNWLCPPNRAYLIRSSSVYIRGCQKLNEPFIMKPIDTTFCTFLVNVERLEWPTGRNKQYGPVLKSRRFKKVRVQNVRLVS